MTIARKYVKTANHAYIYPDGHAVVLHREYIKGHEIEYATVHEKAFEIGRLCKGRLIVHGRASLAHLLASQWISWKAASLENGSPLTKKEGLAIQTIYLAFGGAETWISTIPDLLSGEFTAQDDNERAFEEQAEKTYFGDYRVHAVTRAKLSEPEKESEAAE